MSYIPPHPLALLEILHTIFEFLDRPSFLACVQVNSLWADEATDILWEHSDALALVSLIPSGRAQTYANKVTVLIRQPNFSDDDNGHLLALKHLVFRRLREIYWNFQQPESMQHLIHYIQPALRKPAIALIPPGVANKIGPTYNEAVNAFLMNLRARCPDLQEIIIGLKYRNESGVLRYLEATPSLRSIALYGRGIVDTMVWQHLAARPSLTKLVIRSNISEEVAASVEADKIAPFADLRLFRGRVVEAVIVDLAQHLKKHVTLGIMLLDCPQNLLSTMAHFSSLQELIINFLADDSAIGPLDLLSLARGCQRLEKISLTGLNFGGSIKNRLHCDSLDGSSIKDVDICGFSSLLPRLESLTLGFWGALSVVSLYHLGRNCPRLQYCRLNACLLDVTRFLKYPRSDQAMIRGSNLPETNGARRIVIEEYSATKKTYLKPHLIKKKTAGDIRPLFPKLKTLMFGELSNTHSTTVPVTLSALLSEAPQLDHFHVKSTETFSVKLTEAFGCSCRK